MDSVQILVISLERSVDRRERVLRELKGVSFSWKFLDAVDGFALNKFPTSYIASKVRRLQGYELTLGEIGCYLSHMNAWKQCVETNRSTLVLEDDFVLNGDLGLVLGSLVTLNQEWSLVRLAALYEVPHQAMAKIGNMEIVKNEGDPVGAAAYLIKPSAAAQLIKHSSSIYEPVDHYLEHYHKHGVEMFAVKPYPISIVGKDSTITDRPGRHPIRGLQKTRRSFFRYWDRLFSPDPWFPKNTKY